MNRKNDSLKSRSATLKTPGLKVDEVYGLMQVGWDRGHRVRGNLIYITVHDGQVWVEYDGMEQGVAHDLIQSGIDPERIVLKFVSEAGSPITSKLEYVS